jgi:serine/threonine protein kinase
MIGEAARALDDPDGELSASMVATRPQGALRPRAVPPRPLEPGEVVARYRVVRLIGAGGAGLVHEAFDPQLGRRIALKMVRPDTSDEAARSPTRLLREAQAMARLSHPNVVAVYDAGIFEGQVFVAMELVDGRTVAQWLQETRPGWPAVVRLFVEAGRGLAAAHSAGLIHRDFKPENVLLGDDGRPRVTDFGLARARDLGDPTSSPIATVLSSSPLLTLTDAGVVAGTPAYMAPEQFEGARADERTDQFNFCAALYRALYGQRPFGGEATVTMGALAREVSTGKLRPPPPGTPVPDQVFSLVARGLARDPADRFPALARCSRGWPPA